MRTRRGAVSVGVVAFAMAVAGAALAALAGACGEFSVADGATDAPAPSADARAELEATTPDAAAGVDGPASDAGCEMHAFCADFEEAQPAAGWSARQAGTTGALAITSGGQPGMALLSTITSRPAPATDWAYVVQPFPGANGLHVELDIKAPSLPLDADTVITLVQVSGQAQAMESGVGVVLRSTGLGFYIATGAGASTSPQAAIDLPRGTWAHLALDIRFGTGGRMTLLVDRVSAWNMALDSKPPLTPELRVGVQHYNGATPAVAVLYDTVRVDVLP